VAGFVVKTDPYQVVIKIRFKSWIQYRDQFVRHWEWCGREPGIGNSAEFYSLRGRYTADLGEITHPKNGSWTSVHWAHTLCHRLYCANESISMYANALIDDFSMLLNIFLSEVSTNSHVLSSMCWCRCGPESWCALILALCATYIRTGWICILCLWCRWMLVARHWCACLHCTPKRRRE
jgi:hypothetical protein